MFDKYFKRIFKTVTGVRIAIAIKRPYDWVSLKLRGETILSQSYHFVNHGAIVKVKDINGNILNPDGYTIFSQVWTQSMKDDIEKWSNIDVVAELEAVLVNEINEKIHKDTVDKVFKLGDKKNEND